MRRSKIIIGIFCTLLIAAAGGAPVTLIIPARDFLGTGSANVEAGGGLASAYGPDTLHNAPPYGPASNSATWKVFAPRAGKYHLDVQYAAAESRTVDIYVNDVKVSTTGLRSTTGGWDLNHQCWIHQLDVDLHAGENKVTFARNDVFSHILKLRFTLDTIGYLGCASTQSGGAVTAPDNANVVAIDISGVWVGQTSGNRVRMDRRTSGFLVTRITTNGGQAVGGYLFLSDGGGRYHYTFTDGTVARVQVLAPDTLRITNPGGWTDIFKIVRP